MDAMEKLGEKKEEYNDIEKLEILDGKNYFMLISRNHLKEDIWEN